MRRGESWTRGRKDGSLMHNVQTSHKHPSVPPAAFISSPVLLHTGSPQHLRLLFGFPKNPPFPKPETRGEEVPDSLELECLPFPPETWSVSSRGDLDRRVHIRTTPTSQELQQTVSESNQTGWKGLKLSVSREPELKFLFLKLLQDTILYFYVVWLNLKLSQCWNSLLLFADIFLHF